jgi:hypothetical protein
MVLQFFPKIACAADQNYLVLEGKKVEIGASREQIKALFKDIDSGVRAIEKTDKQIISFYTGVDRYLGEVIFKDDRVVAIHKHWGDYYADFGGLPPFQALYELLTGLTEGGGATAQIWTKQENQPDNQSNYLFINKGKRTAIMHIGGSPSKNQSKVIYIDEHLVE